jgi:hypothetical protein
MRRSTLLALSLALCLALAAHAQTKLELKRPEGKTNIHSTFRFNQTLTIAGMEFPTEVQGEETASQSYGPKAADGTQKVRHKAESLKVKMTLPGAMSLSFDSAKPDEAKSDVPMLQTILDTFKAVSGASYAVVYKDGRVAAIEGVDTFLETVPPNVLDSVKGELNPEVLKRTYAQEAARLPDTPVNKGDRWMRTEVTPIGAGQTLTFDIHYEYLGTVEKDGKTLDKIGMLYSGVKYAIDAQGGLGLTVVNSDLQVEASSGHVLFDRERGEVVEVVSNVRIAGPMTFDVNGMQLPGKVDLTMDGTAVTKR